YSVLKSQEIALLVDSSSPMVLMAQTGSCRFGNDCRYVHDSHAKPTTVSSSKTPSTSTTDALLLQLLEKLGVHDTGSSRNSNTNASNIVAPSLPIAYAANSVSSPLYYLTQPLHIFVPPPGFSTPHAYTTPPGLNSLLAQQMGLARPPGAVSQQQA
ncbi:ribonuclease H-like domain-containing protein, partial [Tanacetum coccineum]